MLKRFLKKKKKKKKIRVTKKLNKLKFIYVNLFVEKYLITILKEFKFLGVNSIVLCYSILNNFLRKKTIFKKKFRRKN